MSRGTVLPCSDYLTCCMFIWWEVFGGVVPFLIGCGETCLLSEVFLLLLQYDCFFKKDVHSFAWTIVLWKLWTSLSCVCAHMHVHVLHTVSNWTRSSRSSAPPDGVSRWSSLTDYKGAAVKCLSDIHRHDLLQRIGGWEVVTAVMAYLNSVNILISAPGVSSKVNAQLKRESRHRNIVVVPQVNCSLLVVTILFPDCVSRDIMLPPRHSKITHRMFYTENMFVIYLQRFDLLNHEWEAT